MKGGGFTRNRKIGAFPGIAKWVFLRGSKVSETQIAASDCASSYRSLSKERRDISIPSTKKVNQGEVTRCNSLRPLLHCRVMRMLCDDSLRVGNAKAPQKRARTLARSRLSHFLQLPPE